MDTVELELTLEQEAASRGARWLDQLYPGWEKDFDKKKSRLDMSCPYNCTAAFVFGDFHQLYEKFSWTDKEIQYYGFSIDTYREDYSADLWEDLADAWEDEADRRL